MSKKEKQQKGYDCVVKLETRNKTFKKRPGGDLVQEK